MNMEGKKEGKREGEGGREEQESGTCSDGGQGEGGSELVRSVLRNRKRQGRGWGSFISIFYKITSLPAPHTRTHSRHIVT